jgi:hypothetical protein
MIEKSFYESMPPNFIVLATWTTGRLGPLKITPLTKNVLENNVDKV